MNPISRLCPMRPAKRAMPYAPGGAGAAGGGYSQVPQALPQPVPAGVR
jgi:hypothetical protein